MFKIIKQILILDQDNPAKYKMHVCHLNPPGPVWINKPDKRINCHPWQQELQSSALLVLHQKKGLQPFKFNLSLINPQIIFLM